MVSWSAKVHWSATALAERNRARRAIVTLLITLCALAPAGAQFSSSKRPDVKYVPTPQNVVDVMLTMARVTANDVVYDLGSGDGRIPITAAQRYGAFGVGVEIEPRLIREAQEHATQAGVTSRVLFYNQDLFTTDLRPATVVTLFLLPRLNLELMPKLRRELRRGARVISHQFDMGTAWPPEQTQDVNGLTVYLWTIR